ncbi:MAG: hypothetical protein ACREQI_09855 [Candidatus Binataceae bacterium]
MKIAALWPANFRNFNDRGFVVSGVKSQKRGDKAIIFSSSIVRIWLETSSAFAPCLISKAIPATTISPAKTMAAFLLSSLLRNRIDEADSGHHASMAISTRMPKTKRSFPLSRHQRWALSAVSSASFIPDSSWTAQDYGRSDKKWRVEGILAPIQGALRKSFLTQGVALG